MTEPCCEANERGFKCQCHITKKGRRAIEAEDNGYADYLYDKMRDERDLSNPLTKEN